MHAFIDFMTGTLGRGARIALGLGVIAYGLLVMQGAAGPAKRSS